MRLAPIAVIGVGNVGRAFVGQIAGRSGSDISVVALADKRGAMIERGGVSRETLASLASGSARIDKLDRARPYRGWEDLTTMFMTLGIPDLTVVDLTAEPSALAHLEWLRLGWKVATANKKPLTDAQGMFDALMESSSGGRYRFTAACGGGLPVIPSLLRCLDAGDDLLEVRAAASGTLGFIFSRCEQGSSFADAVLEAKRLGYTEPDPRDDLSGADVARKALILGRLAGLRLDLADIKAESLVPPALRSRPLENFFDDLDVATAAIDSWFDQVRSQGLTLRYLATVNADGIRTGIEEVPLASAFGSLSGPENMFLIRTRHYDESPFAIRGPGAGAAVTAAGVLADVLSLAAVNSPQRERVAIH